MVETFATTWNKYRQEVRAQLMLCRYVAAEVIVNLVAELLVEPAAAAQLGWRELVVTQEHHGDTVTYLLDTDDDEDNSSGYVVRFDKRSKLWTELKVLEERAAKDFDKYELDVCMEFARRVVYGLREVQTLREPGYVVRKEDPREGFNYFYLDLNNDGWSLFPDDATVFVTYAGAAGYLEESRHAKVIETEGSEELLR